MDDLFDKYAGQAQVLIYLEQMREDIAGHYVRFKNKEVPQLPTPIPMEEPSFREYQLNVFVDNSATEEAPVVVNHPTYPNLFGGIVRQAQFGALIIDFTLLKAEALHQTNGGDYLMLPALDLLRLMPIIPKFPSCSRFAPRWPTA
ncbi:hypothetical protein DFAR_1360003 [Desulfarculales bacterium]